MQKTENKDTHLLVINLSKCHDDDWGAAPKTYYHRGSEAECSKIKDDFILKFNENIEGRTILFIGIMPLSGVCLCEVDIANAVHLSYAFHQTLNSCFSVDLIEI